MKLSALTIDPEKLEKGDWVGDIPELEGVRFKVRGLGNTDYKRLQNRLVLAVPRKNRRNGLSVEDQTRIESRCILDAILLDWDGIEGEDGAPLHFSKELATDLLADPAMARLREGILYAAAIVSEREDDDERELEGNFENASAGS
ncbi:hypothetical protein [Hansschlegelia plantiphila]|uniref:Phage tail protein n=1 Tax=Hansschlegelia plantiphila TaxID=374655 RepID=A0A9W6IXL1_9HYPH|nr:hypothetical protein [Hansschlegelia plantiphila]GLK67006.1 hypothetical protein GCM10008179_06440 [Hansschlegelia plantiphila]